MHTTHCVYIYMQVQRVILKMNNVHLELFSNNSLKVLKCIIAYESLYTNICEINADMLLCVQSIQRPPIFVLSYS